MNYFYETIRKKTDFIDKYSKLLKDDNKFTIKLANKDQYEYIRHLMIVDHKNYFKNDLNIK